VGNVRPSQTNPFGFTAGAKTSYTPTVYGGSMYFDYNGDRLIIPYTPALSQTSPYTLEFWFYPNYNFTGQYLVARNAGGYFGLAWNGTTGIIRVDKHGVGIQITATTALGLNQWHHVAMTYDGTTTRLFTNGILQGSVSGTGGESSANTTIGYYEANTSSSYGGYMSDFRFVKGPALYTSSFVPPAAPLEPITNTTLLVNGTAAAVRDASRGNNLETVGDAKLSTSVVKYGNTSMAFDGTGDYLKTNATPIGSGDFTVEFWVYPLQRTNNSFPGLFDCRSSGSDTNGFGLYFEGGGSGALILRIGGSNNTISSSLVPIGSWTHVAVSRQSGTLKLYINGTSVVSVSNTTDYSRTVHYLGATFDAYTANVYMNDFRVTKGVARYTANFTPPTAALKKK
jgi:hypothetical protein